MSKIDMLWRPQTRRTASLFPSPEKSSKFDWLKRGRGFGKGAIGVSTKEEKELIYVVLIIYYKKKTAFKESPRLGKETSFGSQGVASAGVITDP